MTIRTVQRGIDWGHIALLVVLAGITIWYLHDAWSASSRVRNLILVLPASILALALAAGIAGGVILRGLKGVGDAGPEPANGPAPTLRDRIYPLILMAIFALYILTLPVTGFDVGSALFVIIALMVDGERRPLFLILYPAAFAALCTLLFRWLLPYPMTTLIL
jgi:putative tricarboxylic transport membrane protein